MRAGNSVFILDSPCGTGPPAILSVASPTGFRPTTAGRVLEWAVGGLSGADLELWDDGEGARGGVGGAVVAELEECLDLGDRGGG